MCSARLQQTWKEFPRGLHVLVAISDESDRSEICNALKSCSYQVTAFTSEEDALRSLQSAKSTFHAAMLDATNRDVFDGFKLLAAAKNLAVIMVSSTEDIQTMMRAISLGAADFLQKPFSEEKLKNIWQHVARRAMVGTETTIPSSDELFGDFGSIVGEFSSDSHVDQPSDSKQEFNLEEDFMESASLELCDTSCIKLEVDDHLCIKLEVDDHLPSNQSCIKLEMDDLPADTSCIDEHLDDLDGIVLDAEGGPEFNLDAAIFADMPPDSDSDSALDINFELLDSGDTHDFQNSGDTTHDSEFDREDAMMLAQVLQAETEDQVACNISESSESMSITSSSTRDKGEEQTKPERASKPSNKSGPARKKMKVDWTPELHHKFVQAVEQLGVDKAIPSRILEHMGVKCLTRHNIASHLQKYRSHRKHLLQREAEAAANWRSKNKASIQPRHQTPILPAPPPGGVPLVVWGHPTVDPCTGHLWQHPAPPPPTWQAPDGTLWQHPAACFPPWGHHAPAPGTPVYPTCMRAPVAPMIGVPQQPVAPQENHLNPPSCLPPREVVDAVISEALTNPCTLPLGLKPPSMESVMSELVKQGISITPPTPS